nr:carboxypeptidase-like regulatory domain-containing protein [Candidatus Cloacimonadota bacterium]
MQKKLLILITIILLVSVSLFSATTGKLAGRVKDDKGNNVPYANVILKGTTIGAMTDEQGKFMIINIPPGTYTVVCQLMGYAPYEMTGVRINVDETRTVNISLSKKTIQMQAVKVVAKEELVTKDRAGSSKSISADQISDIAVSDISGVIAMQAGVTQKDGQLFVRGGRANEVNFTVDGMSVSDPVDGGSALSVDMDAVADMKVITGGLTAEYGNAQSGMVNIVSKDGSSQYEGKIEGTTDHLFQDASNMDEVKFAIGGPMIPFGFDSLKDKLTFFLNGAGAWTDGRFREFFKNNPNQDLRYITSVAYDTYDPYSERDELLGFQISNRNYNDYNVNLKTKYVISPTQNVSLAIRGDRSYYTPFSHSWKYALQHYFESETNQRQIMLTYDLTIGTKSNLKVKLSQFEKTTYQNPRGIDKENYIWQDNSNYNPSLGLLGYSSVDNNGDGIFDYGFNESSSWAYSIDGLDDPVAITGFRAPGSIWDNFIDDKTATLNLRADYEYQMNEIIGFKTGFELIKHKIEKNQL